MQVKRTRLGAIVAVLLCSVLAFAAFTPITPFTLPKNNQTITAGQLTVAMTSCDAANGNQYVYSGRDVLLLQNTDASPHPITVNTIADPYGGTNTSLTSYSLPANSISAIQMQFSQGWLQTGGVIQIASGCSNLIKIAILQYN